MFKGMFGGIYVIVLLFLVYDGYEKHPRISAKERVYLEKNLEGHHTAGVVSCTNKHGTSDNSWIQEANYFDPILYLAEDHNSLAGICQIWPSVGNHNSPPVCQLGALHSRHKSPPFYERSSKIRH